MRLEHKIALVTGGAKGIGEAIVRVFAREKAAVLIADLCEDEGIKLAGQLKAEGYQAAFVRTNVGEPADIQAAVNEAVSRFGGLDILVNNAGIVEQDCLLEDETQEEWTRVLSVNLHGTFLGCRYALPYLKRSKGCIVNIASISGITATRGCAAYCASKAGVIGLSRALAADYAPFGVRVNALCPSACETPMMKQYFTVYSEEEVREKVSRLSGPIGRMCLPEEIANGVLFLASPENSYLSGLTFPVDGGYTAV